MTDQLLSKPLTFDDYIKNTEIIIKKVRPDLKKSTLDEANTIVQANIPFIWESENKQFFNANTGKYTQGVLLIHGLFASPFQMMDIARYLNQQGYLVCGVLLAGHGTTPTDLLETQYSQWIETVQFGVEKLQERTENIHLVGYSLGAALAIDQALNHGGIKSLILLAPAIKIRMHLRMIIMAYKLVDPIKKLPDWYRKSPLSSYALYTSQCVNAATQVLEMTQKNSRTLKEKGALSIPIFMGISEDDEVVSSKAALRFFKQQTSPQNRCLLYSKKTKKTNHSQIHYCNSVYPDQNILDFSHTCLPFAPENPHVGENGDFKDFLHYKDGRPNGNKPFAMGAISPQNLKKYALQRLNYHPDFEGMMGEIVGFLASISISCKNQA